MLFRTMLSYLCLAAAHPGLSQENKMERFYMADSIRISIDYPGRLYRNKETIICFYALPNGNTTEQTMGKLMQPGDDWHFDIQHIAAQTQFIRKQLKQKNFIVIYLENKYRSWPGWKQRNPDFSQRISNIIDTLAGLVNARKKSIYLNGHSGGGSFIFGYLAGQEKIPSRVKRISFLDSNYGYDSRYDGKLKDWLNEVKGTALNLFAYNDSIALYNGKPVVSATGGTWHRGHLMMLQLGKEFLLSCIRNDSLVVYKSNNERIQFFFKTNPDRKIYHTQQVELNGFIHSVLCGTSFDSRGYTYYGPRAYSEFIR
jgi:hypothetical protein